MGKSVGGVCGEGGRSGRRVGGEGCVWGRVYEGRGMGKGVGGGGVCRSGGVHVEKGVRRV